MNESTVMFWQVMLVLQIQLAAGVYRFVNGMARGLTGFWAFFAKRKGSAGHLGSRNWMLKSVKGEKI